MYRNTKTERPSFCNELQASAEMCGDSKEYAMHWLAKLEQATKPSV